MSQLALALGYGHTPEGRSVLLRRAPSVRIKERRNEQWRLRVGRRYKLSNTLAHKRAPLAPNLNVVQGSFGFQQNRAFFASPATPTLKFGATGPKCCLIYIVNSTGVRLRWSSEAPCIGKQIGTHRGRCLRSGGMCRVSSVPCCVWCVQCLLSCVCVYPSSRGHVVSPLRLLPLCPWGWASHRLSMAGHAWAGPRPRRAPAALGPAAFGPVAPGPAAPARPRLARPRPAVPRLFGTGVPGPAWPGPPGLACPCLGVGAQLGPN